MAVETPPVPAKILVVDDEPGMRLTLSGILRRKGYQVHMAEDGPSALEAARREDFRLVFMDIKMPGMSGVDAFIELKRILPKAAVIMMTAYALDEEIRRAIHEGAYTILNKPFDMPRVLGLIAEALEDRALVMVVDDRPGDARLLQAILEQKGLRVVAVETGQDCLAQLKERRFQVILLDIKMPGMDGLETLRRLKEIRRDTAVIMMTGYTVEDLVQDALKEGSIACVHKPFDVAELLAVVGRSLEAG